MLRSVNQCNVRPAGDPSTTLEQTRVRLSPTLFLVGALTLCLAGAMLLPLGAALYFDDGSAGPLLKSILATLAAGGFLLFVFKPGSRISISHREGMAVVTLAWISAGFFGALPYLIGGTFETLTEAVFEAVSGFTTTGASVLTDIEAVPKGLLLWRSLTHWIGGMGIIVLSVAILPFLGVGGMELYKAEIPSPVVDRLRPRVTETARTLWLVYLLLTVAQIILLMAGGMDLFEAACHTFGTLATGGFSTKNASLAAYSPYLQYVVIVFMVLAGINFSLHYRALLGRPLTYFRDSELKLFLALVGGFSLIIFIRLAASGSYPTMEETFRHSLFQVASILTTTGYATADFELWPTLPIVLLLLAMFIGGSAGSTGGGIKVLRLILLLKQGHRELKRLIHPHGVYALKLGGQAVPAEVLNAVWGFLALYLLLFMTGFLAMAGLGLDLTTAFSSVLACIGNIGPGLGAVGPTDNFAGIPATGKWVLTLCMLLGRLEIYTVIILLVPEFWRR